MSSDRIAPERGGEGVASFNAEKATLEDYFNSKSIGASSADIPLNEPSNKSNRKTKRISTRTSKLKQTKISFTS
jgi:hypothetical protein